MTSPQTVRAPSGSATERCPTGHAAVDEAEATIALTYALLKIGAPLKRVEEVACG